MKTRTKKSNFNKYISTSIEGPFETVQTNKVYYKCSFELLIPKRRITNGIDKKRRYVRPSAQTRAYVKLFFEDTHKVMFNKCEKAIINDKPLIIVAEYTSLQTQPFYVKDKEGNILKNKSGDDRIGHRISMFLMQDENFNTEFRRILRSLTFTE